MKTRYQYRVSLLDLLRSRGAQQTTIAIIAVCVCVLSIVQEPVIFQSTCFQQTCISSFDETQVVPCGARDFNDFKAIVREAVGNTIPQLLRHLQNDPAGYEIQEREHSFTRNLN